MEILEVLILELIFVGASTSNKISIKCVWVWDIKINNNLPQAYNSIYIIWMVLPKLKYFKNCLGSILDLKKPFLIYFSGPLLF